MADVCRQPMKYGPCRGNFQRWYYDSSTKSCRQFVYGGCWGNDNRFLTKEICEQSCRGVAQENNISFDKEGI